jgi:anti-sigma regulatory factor (Ser/Thr protein kinase)
MTISAVAGEGASASSRELTLDPGPASVRRARCFVRGALCDLGFPECVDDGVVIVSELMTNVILWAARLPCSVVVRVGGGGGYPVIEVHDGSSELPERREIDFVSVHGRGLHIVDALSAGWECVPSGAGKAVIVKLPSRQWPPQVTGKDARK